MENPTSITLIIKAANQKCADFTLQCESNWSIRYLKSYLSRNYPAKPIEGTIRLIYSGKLLNDDSELKDCIRINNENNHHNIHIVYKPLNDIEEEQTSNNKQNFSANLKDHQNNDTTLHEENNNNLQSNNGQQTHLINNLEFMTPKEQHDYIFNQLKMYYESIGTPISNSWNITYLHHTALYYQMYSNYLRSIGLNPVFNNLNSMNGLTNNNANNIEATNLNQENNNQQIPQPNNNNNNNNNIDAELRAEEREDDWLSLLHNFCSFLILFSIVYFYSTLTRFMIVFVVVILLTLYHAGWFSLERRNVRNNINRANQPQVNEANNNNNNNNEQNNLLINNNNNENENNINDQDNVNNIDNNNNINENNVQPQPSPNLLRLIFSFIITFFTSLIPERARIPN